MKMVMRLLTSVLVVLMFAPVAAADDLQEWNEFLAERRLTRAYEEATQQGEDISWEEFKAQWESNYQAEKAAEEAYDEGYDAGVERGKRNGHTEGYAEGYFDGEDEGYAEGYSEGYAAAQKESRVILLVVAAVATVSFFAFLLTKKS